MRDYSLDLERMQPKKCMKAHCIYILEQDCFAVCRLEKYILTQLALASVTCFPPLRSEIASFASLEVGHVRRTRVSQSASRCRQRCPRNERTAGNAGE